MPQEFLVEGQWTLKQNVPYALPPFPATIFTDATSPTLQQSNTAAFTANSAVTLTGGSANLTGGFVRSTGGDVVVTVTRR